MAETDDAQRPAVRSPGRRNKTAESLIDVSIAMLAERGEAGFRVEDVLQACDASPSSLYHHFGSRDGLIEAATFEAYRRASTDDLDAIRAAFAEAVDPDDLEARLDASMRSSTPGALSARRLERLRLLGAAVTRPALLAKFGQDVNRVTEELSQVFDRARSRGVLRSDLDSRQAAMFLQSYTFGLVLDDIAGDGTGTAGWSRILRGFAVGSGDQA